jgi:hypothetical protein
MAIDVQCGASFHTLHVADEFAGRRARFTDGSPRRLAAASPIVAGTQKIEGPGIVMTPDPSPTGGSPREPLADGPVS